MIDDILASKWSRINEKTKIHVILQNCDISHAFIFCFHFFLVFTEQHRNVIQFMSFILQNSQRKTEAKVTKPRKKHKSPPTNEEFLISLKMKEKR